MEITILVKSSSQSKPRSVLVVLDDSGLSFVCDCPAGERGRMCKHKKAIASANDSMLFDDDQMKNFKQVMEWIDQSGYPELMQELRQAENELDSAKAIAREIKVKITRVMKEGLK